MGYLVKAIVGGGMFIGGIVLFNVKLLALLDTGTCASGNVPYEIAPGYECPSGTGTDVLLLTASIFIGLIGAGLFAFRGRPPWGSGRGASFGGMFGFGTFAWGLFFTSTGVVALISGFGDDSLGADSELGAKIVGFTFLFMGLPALLISLWGVLNGVFRGGRDEHAPLAPTGPSIGDMRQGNMMERMRSGLASASGAQQIGARMGWGSAGSVGGSGDAIGKIERLQKLRESGALSKEEFDREKAKVLAEQ